MHLNDYLIRVLKKTYRFFSKKKFSDPLCDTNRQSANTKLYNLLIQAENTKLTIIGHTDNTGNSQANMTLSKGRANSVVDYLVNKGISSDRFQLVDGKGDTDPASENNTSVGKAKNRRVVITLLK